jgi:hypothetical protein
MIVFEKGPDPRIWVFLDGHETHALECKESTNGTPTKRKIALAV